MFSPKLPQDELKKRSSDIEDVQKDHSDYVKKTNVRLIRLENDNARQKEINHAYKEELYNKGREIDLIKEALKIMKQLQTVHETRFVVLEQKLDALLNAKVDLAAKIVAAQKRLDDS